MICHASKGNCKQQHKMFCVPPLCPCIPPLPLSLAAEEPGMPQHQHWDFRGEWMVWAQQQRHRSATKNPSTEETHANFNLQLLSLATEDTSSPHLAAGWACGVCGLSFLGGNSAGQPITHTPALTADIPVLTPRAALSYFRESHFHIPPSNSPPRSDQSLSAFTLQ